VADNSVCDVEIRFDDDVAHGRREREPEFVRIPDAEADGEGVRNFAAKSAAKTALKFAPKAAQISKRAALFRGVLCWLSASITSVFLPLGFRVDASIIVWTKFA
jgi:hypothetical protein